MQYINAFIILVLPTFLFMIILFMAFTTRSVNIDIFGFRFNLSGNVKKVENFFEWVCFYNIVQRISRDDFYAETRVLIHKGKKNPGHNYFVMLIKKDHLSKGEEFQGILYIFRGKKVE